MNTVCYQNRCYPFVDRREKNPLVSVFFLFFFLSGICFCIITDYGFCIKCIRVWDVNGILFIFCPNTSCNLYQNSCTIFILKIYQSVAFFFHWVS